MEPLVAFRWVWYATVFYPSIALLPKKVWFIGSVARRLATLVKVAARRVKTDRVFTSGFDG